jgi:inosine-uridine nucleoside N-ribohydrolase
VRYLSLVLIMFLSGKLADASEPSALWIDADPGCHRPGWSDVDDCLAIAHLLAERRPVVRGISSVFGNSPRAATRDDLYRVLELIGIPGRRINQLALAEGASDPRSDMATPATRAIVAALERERVGIVALGPLTNVAAVLRQRPDLASRIAFVIFVGGRSPGESFKLPEQRLLHFHDQNVQFDTAALRAVLASAVPLKLVPFHTTIRMRVTTAALAEALSLTPALRSAAERWESLWALRLGVAGFVPFDLVAASLVTTRGAFSCVNVHVEVVDPGRALTHRRRQMVLTRSVGDSRVVRCELRPDLALREMLSREPGVRRGGWIASTPEAGLPGVQRRWSEQRKHDA